MLKHILYVTFLFKIFCRLAALFVVSPAFAETALYRDSIFSLSLEELVSVRVSVSDRSSEKLIQSTAALKVLTSEDIKHSGIRTIPELMRLVPGFQVRRLDGNKWAVNSRRIPSRFASSMLVLMDGRTLYNPLFAGTYWDVQDILIEDIEKIEVVRGPGSSAWGANAITGVINIVTKDASETQSNLVYAGAGRGELDSDVAIRVAGDLGSANYRWYAKQRRTAEGVYLTDDHSDNRDYFPDESSADDGIKSSQLGFRLDQGKTGSSHSFQGNVYESESDEIRLLSGSPSRRVVPNLIESDGYSLSYAFSDSSSTASSLEINAYIDHTEKCSDAFGEERDIYNMELIHHSQLDSHRVSLGGSYRYTSDDTMQSCGGVSQSAGGGTFALNPASRTDDLFGFFVQDKWSIPQTQLTVLAGMRVERNDYTDWEYNPTLRVSYALQENSLVWAAISRSVRTPSRGNADAYLNFSNFNAFCQSMGADFRLDSALGCILPLDIRDLESISTVSSEIGYRALANSAFTIDFSSYYDREIDPLADRLISRDIESTYCGQELEIIYQTGDDLRITGSLSYLNYDEGSTSTRSAREGELWNLRLSSRYHIKPGLWWNLLIYFDEGLPRLSGAPPFKNTTRVDTNLIWEINPHVELRFMLNNLLDDYHYEAGDAQKLSSAIERGGFLQVVYQF